MDAQQADEALMLLYGKGDSGAFEMLYHRHKGSVYRYIKRHVGILLDCDELFQDVWAKVITAASTYQATAKFSTWLYTIAHRCIIDGMRKLKNSPIEQSVVVDAPTEEEGQHIVSITNTDNPMVNVSVQQQMDTLLTTLTMLPADQREVFLLKHEAGFSVKEIAEIIGIGEETAKTRLRYAMTKIRSSMGFTRGDSHE